MKTMLVAFTSALFASASVVTLVPASVDAATITTYTQYTLGTTCDYDSAGSGAVASSCGSFTAGDGVDARASYGDIGLRSQVDGPSSVVGGTGGSTVEDYDFWRGSAAFNDTLSFSIDSGTLRLYTDIAATLIEGAL